MERVSKDQIKEAARGNWHLAYQQLAGLPEQILDGKEHPCPKCGGTTRFRAMHDFAETGGIYCTHCDGPGGDGIAGIQWLTGDDFPGVVKGLSDHLGIDSEGEPQATDIIEVVCRAKSIPREGFEKYGVTAARRGRNKQAVARVCVYNEAGEIHSYFDMSPDSKGLFKRGRGSSGLFLPGRVPKPGETWLLVEGVKDAAALTGMGYFACGLPTSRMTAKYAHLFAGCNIVVVPDLDETGSSGADITASRLSKIAATVRVARLPGEIKLSGGEDVRDVWKKHGEKAVTESIETAKTWKPSEFGGTDPDGSLPRVEVGLNEAAVARKVVHHLGSLSGKDQLFQRGGKLIRVNKDPMPESSGITIAEPADRISELPKASLREKIPECCSLFSIRPDVKGDLMEVAERPPVWLVSAIHERGEFPEAIKPLTGIIQSPTVRADGTVLQKPGYDSKTQLIYRPKIKYPKVADSPTQEDAANAARRLLDLVCDFPFKDDAHKSAWLSMLITMVARPAINGPCPMFLIDASVRGSGKSKLADVASIIAYGTPAARKAWARDDEEVRKAITSVALAALPAVLFDNVASVLGGASLDAALTATTWQDRVLGKSEMSPVLPLTQVWMATGNNVALGADTARRTMYCRLESPLENPEDRDGFKYTDLLGFTRDNRAKLAIDALTIVRAWFSAGSPIVAKGSWGSFEAWSATVRQAVVWCGLSDPLETKQEVRDADRSAELLGLVHDALREVDPDGRGVSASRLVDLFRSDADLPALRAAVAEISDKPTPHKLGSILRELKGRIRKNECISQIRTKTARLWVLVNTGGVGDTCTHGDTYTQPSGNQNGAVSPRGTEEHIEVSKADGRGACDAMCHVSPECNHLNAAADAECNEVVDGKVLCRACGKFLGNAPNNQTARLSL